MSPGTRTGCPMPVTFRQLGMAGRKGAGGPFPVDKDPHGAAFDLVLLHLGNVVGDVIDDRQSEVAG